MAAPKWRYSPLNALIVDWSYNGDAFNACGLPDPLPCPDAPEPTEPVCHALPLREAINTYDWERWLPEVIVGIEDADEEIAASYVREATIEFCKRARVLQRVVVLEIQPDVRVYPFEPYDQENIIGVMGFAFPHQPACWCSHATQGNAEGIDWRFDVARNEIELTGALRRHSQIAFRVWAAPTEESCAQDVFLYENFRGDIAQGARTKYALAVHFRDRALLSSLMTMDTWEQRMIRAKNKVYRSPSATNKPAGSTLWGNNCVRTRR